MANDEGKKPWKLDVDWDQVQHARDSGEKVSQIAKRLGVHESSVYVHTSPAGKRGAAKRGKIAKTASYKPAKNGSAIGTAILELESKRAEIEQAIQTLKRLEGL